MNRRLLDPGSLDGVDPFYLPEAGNTFELPCFWVEAERLHVFSLGATSARRHLFFIHPEAVFGYRAWLKGCAPGPRHFATATSSTRTVVAWPEASPTDTRCLKLSLPVLFASERRVVTAELARDAVETTRRLRHLRTGLRIVPETLGLVPRDADLGGYLVRELPRVPLTPWFALEHPERHIRGFLRAWLKSAVEHGWVADVHAQNILVSPGPTWWVRDMDSVWLDDPELEGARTSLHTFFLGGPARNHRALFFRELERLAGKAAREPDTFAQWLEDERHFRRKAPKPPTGVRRWLAKEQSGEGRARDPRRFAKVTMAVLPRRFRPEEKPVWRLPYFVAPRGRVHIYGTERPPALFTSDGGVRVFFHPFMAEHHALDVLEFGAGTEAFWATPTSSPRSVVVWNARGELFGLKLSLDVELLGINRKVDDSKLKRAVEVSSALRDVRYLREPVAVRTEEKDYGFIYRELLPGSEMNALTPGFLWKREPPWRALVETFAKLAFGQGLIGDLHRQNVLLTPKGEVVLRDLDAFKRAPAKEYQRAWVDALRAEWMYGQKTKRWAEVDGLLFEQLEQWLGRDVVEAERAELRRRGWKTLHDPRDPSEPLYSLDAMVRSKTAGATATWPAASPQLSN
ncbi:MAG: hypothetical protein JNK82_20180 [Myxococcaceae bacterium]|nr:hypothetical protein [Myxococcaceae bacterium]